MFTLEYIRSYPYIVVDRIKQFGHQELNELQDVIYRRSGKDITIVRNAINDRLNRLKELQENADIYRIHKSHSIDEVQSIRNEYHNKRNCPVHLVADEKLRELNTIQKHEERVTKVTNRIHALADRLERLSSKERTKQLVEYHGRSIGNDLYDFPVLWTGLESATSLEQRKLNPSYKPVADHCWPRLWAGTMIVEALYEPLYNAVLLAGMIRKFSEVNFVTKEENERLVTFQKPENFCEHYTWQISYNHAEIYTQMGDRNLSIWDTTEQYRIVWDSVIIGLQKELNHK